MTFVREQAVVAGPAPARVGDVVAEEAARARPRARRSRNEVLENSAFMTDSPSDTIVPLPTALRYGVLVPHLDAEVRPGLLQRPAEPVPDEPQVVHDRRAVAEQRRVEARSSSGRAIDPVHASSGSRRAGTRRPAQTPAAAGAARWRRTRARRRSRPRTAPRRSRAPAGARRGRRPSSYRAAISRGSTGMRSRNVQHQREAERDGQDQDVRQLPRRVGEPAQRARTARAAPAGSRRRTDGGRAVPASRRPARTARTAATSVPELGAVAHHRTDVEHRCLADHRVARRS